MTRQQAHGKDQAAYALYLVSRNSIDTVVPRPANRTPEERLATFLEDSRENSERMARCLKNIQTLVDSLDDEDMTP